MRFGKRLALAMLRDAGEAPYLSQKELKHVLVGLEKLCKAYFDQLDLLKCEGTTRSELKEFSNSERSKYGLPERDGILDISEIVSRDEALLTILSEDIVRIRRYIEKCEATLMEGLNDLLESAASSGLLVTNRQIYASHKDSTDILTDFQALEAESIRIKQYTEVNGAAVRKIMNRRKKNVAECFWFADDFTSMGHICTPETPEIGSMIASLSLVIRGR